MKRPLACALALVLLAVPAAAQDTPPEEKETTLDSLPDDDAASDAEAKKAEDQKNAAILSEALQRLRRAQDLVVRGKIEHKESEQAVGPLGGMPIQVRRRMAGVFGRGLAPFTGTVEAWAAGDGTTVVLSEADVPGFAIYTRGDRTITRRTTEDGEELPLDNVTKELVPLLDVMRLTRHLASAELKAVTDPATGAVTFTGELARELVRPLGDGGGFNRVRTLRVDAALVVAADGRFERISVKVTHNDPIAESQRGGVRIIVQGGQGGQIVPVEEEKSEEKHDLEGGKTTYTLTFEAGEPSERAKDFRRRIEALLEK